jgi:hypothetical protein
MATEINPNHSNESPDPPTFVALLIALIDTEGFAHRVMIQSFDATACPAAVAKNFRRCT